MSTGMGWLGIVRCGLIQASLGSTVVLATSTFNRVMVVEWALPAVLPGILVAIHYAVQMSRPKWGHSSDVGGKRVRWICGGMTVLAAGVILAAVATALMGNDATAGIALGVGAFIIIGIGVGAAGTSLLALLATRVSPKRRGAAATVTWLMMIFGIAVTATVAGKLLDPFTPERLVFVTVAVASMALLVTFAASWKLDAPSGFQENGKTTARKTPFRAALSEVWRDPEAKRFTIFVFASMLAFNTQDLILEPFAGLVFGMTPGESTKLTGIQHGGMLAGMLLVAFACSGPLHRYIGSLRGWTIGGCIGSGIMMATLAVSGSVGGTFPLNATVFLLGLANGAFAVAAIGSMMKLAGAGREATEGIRIGVWGAAQAVAFGLGGFLGTVLVDAMRMVTPDDAIAYGAVFGFEACLFIVSAVLASRIRPVASAPATQSTAGSLHPAPAE